MDKSYYSVPPEYLGHQVWVRWDTRVVRIFNERMEQICIHARQSVGQFSTKREHIASQKISAVERGVGWYLCQVSVIGPQTKKWAESLVAVRGVQSVRVLQGLIALTKKHDSEAIEAACETALSYESYRLKTIRELIRRGAPKQEQFEFLDVHPIIRNIADYGDLIRTSLRKEAQRR